MNAPTMNTPLTPLEYYNLVRERIEHEDNLIVQRLTWLVGSQSFLFTAYAIVSNGLMSQPPQPACLHFGEQLQLLFQLIPIVAMLTCVLIYISILAAVITTSRLRRGYRSRFGPEEDALPPIMTAAPVHLFGLVAPLFLPLMFTVIWLILWMHGQH
jgi:hypothetical protein